MGLGLHSDEKDKSGVSSEGTFTIEMEYSTTSKLLICMFKIKHILC
jgi:hypothetical protein